MCAGVSFCAVRVDEPFLPYNFPTEALMANLPTDLFDSLLETLAPRCATLDNRQTLLTPLLNGHPIYRRIDWSGDATAFCTRLIALLSARQLSAVAQRLKTADDNAELFSLVHIVHGDG